VDVLAKRQHIAERSAGGKTVDRGTKGLRFAYLSELLDLLPVGDDRSRVVRVEFVEVRCELGDVVLQEGREGWS
jgi:hypothetical protein